MRNLHNLTLTVDPEVAHWARVKAARDNTSVSRLVGDLLRERMENELGYDRAKRFYLSVQRGPISDGKSRYPRREELHARARFR